jgi:hypothetical protein
MSYIEPKHVISPKNYVSNVIPVYDGGEKDCSVALLKWEGQDGVGMRWNGGSEPDERPTPGNPQSRGLPTWFLIPDDFEVAILQTLLDKGLLGGGSIDKAKAEPAVRAAIAARGGKGEAAVPASDSLEEKMLVILEKFKAEGKL